MQSQDNRYKCKLCTDQFPLWVTLSKARAHEDTELHVIRTRRLDRPPEPPAAPNFTAKRDTAAITNVPSTGSLPSLHRSHSHVPSFPNFRSRTHMSMPGPRRASDPPDQIYDDHGGEWYRAASRSEPPQEGVIELNEDDPSQSTAQSGLDHGGGAPFDARSADEHGTSNTRDADLLGTPRPVEYIVQYSRSQQKLIIPTPFLTSLSIMPMTRLPVRPKSFRVVCARTD